MCFTRSLQIFIILGAFLGPPPPITDPNSLSAFMLQASGPPQKKFGAFDFQLAPQHPSVTISAETSSSTPLGLPPFVSSFPFF